MICVDGSKGMGWLKLDSWVVSEKEFTFFIYLIILLLIY